MDLFKFFLNLYYLKLSYTIFNITCVILKGYLISVFVRLFVCVYVYESVELIMINYMKIDENIWCHKLKGIILTKPKDQLKANSYSLIFTVTYDIINVNQVY